MPFSAVFDRVSNCKADAAADVWIGSSLTCVDVLHLSGICRWLLANRPRGLLTNQRFSYAKHLGISEVLDEPKEIRCYDSDLRGATAHSIQGQELASTPRPS